MESSFLSEHREIGLCDRIGRTIQKIFRIDDWMEVTWPNFVRKVVGLFFTLFFGYVFFGISYIAYRDHGNMYLMPHEWLGAAFLTIYTFLMLVYWLSYDITSAFLRLKRKWASSLS